MWIAIANIDVLIPFVCFYSTFHPHDFGLVEKFHTEKVLHVNLFKFLGGGWRNFISSGLFIIYWLLVPLIMNLAIAPSVETLEKQLFSIFISRFHLTDRRHKEFNLYELLFRCDFFNNFLGVAFESVASDVSFFNCVMVQIVKFSYW